MIVRRIDREEESLVVVGVDEGDTNSIISVSHFKEVTEQEHTFRPLSYLFVIFPRKNGALFVQKNI